jgi:hypothetical protein
VTNAIEAGLLLPADSAVGAAALVRKDEAAAAARRAAVRYLGTVDCNWWPEAEEALRNALLKDRNECVRLEAAIALQKGCCCNVRIVKALADCVSSTGIPPENSERVKMAAMVALSRCCGATEMGPVEPLPVPDQLELLPKKVELNGGDRSKRSGTTEEEQVMQRARRILAQASSDGQTGGAMTSMSLQRPGNVSQLLSVAFGPGNANATASGVAEQAPPASASLTQAAPIPVAAKSTAVTMPAPVRTIPQTPVAPATIPTERNPLRDNLMLIWEGKRIDRSVTAPVAVPVVSAPSTRSPYAEIPVTRNDVSASQSTASAPSQMAAEPTGPSQTPVVSTRAILCPPTER